MPHPQGFLKDTKMPPNDNPNEDCDPQEASMGESTEVPPWVVPLKLPRTLDAPTTGSRVGGQQQGMPVKTLWGHQLQGGGLLQPGVHMVQGHGVERISLQ